MPISNSYPKGLPIEDQDLFVGTKAYNNRTVNYTAQGVADYLNINSKVAIGGQMSFQFTIVPNIPKTIAFEGGFGNNTAFSAINKLIVSAIDASTANITIFLNYLNNSQVLLSQQNQPNFFGHYKITGYAQIGPSAFYELDLEFIGGNGTIGDKQYYDLVSFVLSTETSPTEWGTITGDIEDQTDLINYISSQITTPTLQEVLDNNHDLVDGNFFAGTGAGVTNTGNAVIAIGDGAAGDNSGISVNALGILAAQGNSGTEINAFGDLAAFLNEGSYVNGLGSNAATVNSGDYVNAFGSSAGSDNTFDHVNLLGQNAQADEDGQTVLSKDGTIMARISTTDLTDTRKYNLPDADGTIALTTDITTPTLQEVTDEGNFTDKSIYVTDALGNYLVLGQEGSTPSLDFGLTIWDNTAGAEYSQYFIGRMSYQINGDYYVYLMPDSQYPTGIGIKRLATTDDIVPQVNSDWNSTSGVSEILNKPTIPAAQVNSDWNATSGVAEILNKPTITNGTVTSVGLTMPSAFTVTNSPITSSGDIAVTGAGLVSQYVRGDGTLANFPNSTGGGSSVNYYLNGSVSQGTFGGTTYYQMSKTPILGAGTNFIRTNGAGNGYIASFITDAGDPSQLNIPGGNWNVEFYFNASSGGGSPSFYAELYKVSATNVFTLIASDSLNPEGITNGTTVDQYFTSIPVPQTTLLVTDRLAVRIFVNTGGRTITLHTENGNLSEVLTTFTTGLTALNGLTQQVQYFDVGTGATNFNISSSGDTHTFNLLFNIRRNANNSSNNNINYNGYAVTGSAESSAVWTITRLTIAASGSITVATATNVAWTDRETTIYT